MSATSRDTTWIAHEFDRRAATYDESEMHRWQADQAVQLLRPQPGQRILDIATGTGLAARACVRITHAPQRIVGSRRFSRHAAGCRSGVDEQLSASRCGSTTLPASRVRCAALHRRHSLLARRCTGSDRVASGCPARRRPRLHHPRSRWHRHATADSTGGSRSWSGNPTPTPASAARIRSPRLSTAWGCCCARSVRAPT
jgi:hypothetical protein